MIREEKESEERRCAGAHKVEKPRNTVFFQCFVANCTPLWREADLEAKMLKTPHVRRTFGTPLWREGHFQAKMVKTHYCRTARGS